MTEKIATRKAYGHALVEMGELNKSIVVLDADLSESTMTADFGKQFPKRFFNMGVAEQNMAGVAAGLALSGKTVFMSSFAMFATGRAYEIIRNSIGYTKANVKICASHAGLSVGEDGATHQAIEDLSLMRSIPGMIVISPSDYVSAKKIIKQLAEMNGPAYVQLGRPPVPIIYDDTEEFVIGRAKCLKEGSDVTVIAVGSMVYTSILAAEELSKEGISVRVIDMHTIKPIDEDAIIKAAKETKGIVTVEEHSIIGGLGSAVAEVLSEKCPAWLKRIGINDAFGQSGTPSELLDEYGINKEHIISSVKEMMK